MIYQHWRDYVETKKDYVRLLTKKVNNAWNVSLENANKQAIEQGIEMKKMTLVERQNIKNEFVKRYFSLRNIIYSENLDEYRLIRSIFPSSVYTLVHIDFRQIRQQMISDSKEYFWQGRFRYQSAFDRETLNYIKDIFGATNNLIQFDIVTRASLYSLIGIRRPRLFLNFNQEYLEYHLEISIITFMKQRSILPDFKN